MSDRTKKYIKLSDIDHILNRPDMYVGSIQNIQEEIYISDPINFTISKETLKYSQALSRIFIEALSNAIDNVQRSKETDTPCTKIKITIDIDSGLTTIWNDGSAIPVEKNGEDDYIHTMIFGQLRTSSNYNDSEERLVSGKNGYGVKILNVFSKFFSVKGFDPHTQLIFSQTWKDNMKIVTEPILKSCKNKNGYTEISFIPDFSRFKMTGYTKDTLKIFLKYIVDAAMLTKVHVYFNDILVPAKNLLEYAKLYNNQITENLYIKTPTHEVVIMPNTTGDEFKAISFVNGIHTPYNGRHVDSWSETIFRPIVDKLNKKDKPSLTIKDVKQFFYLFVNITVPNPEFSSQTKMELTGPSITTQISQQHLSKIFKWSVMSNIEHIIRTKDLISLKKVEKQRTKKIDGVDQANYAGTKRSEDCCLILCEGDSAKPFAVTGLDIGMFGKKGRDWIGIMTLRGKILNARNATPTQISNNQILTNLIRALNIHVNVDYTDNNNFKTLNYGRIVMLTDADADGLHIGGLILNFFHAMYPSIFKRQTPFIVNMLTPIVKVSIRNSSLTFYDERKFREFMVSHGNSKITAKYYKGLGTSTEEEVFEVFGKRIAQLTSDSETDSNMDKIFNKTQSDARKQWLEMYDPNTYHIIPDTDSVFDMNISSFLNHEVIKHSLDNCHRNIPNLMDGLKESQRKVLYSCFLKNLNANTKQLKVAQLAGFVAEKTNYHHGEQNLYGCITGMATCFVGSNNIPLLYRGGQFGCLDPDTDIRMYNGSILKAYEIQQEDILLGDDLKPRFVKETVKGIDFMFRIIQGDGTEYIVNSQHILTLAYKRQDLVDISLKKFLEMKDTRDYEGVKNIYGDFKFYDIQVIYMGRGPFCGWSVTDNERFLLGDFTITHNSRLNGGDDASKARYIFTRLESVTRNLFHPDDDVLLEKTMSDGDMVEPRFYIPIIPTVLLNGVSAGIGTGWSSTIPSFNPRDICDAVKYWIKHDKTCDGLSLTPWYRGFKGTIEKHTDNRFITRGICERITDNKVMIKELPIGLWTDTFKETLETLVDEKRINSMSSYSTTNTIQFEIKEKPDFTCDINSLKLYSYISISNMVLYDENDKITKFDSVNTIIDRFCRVRMKYYILRKQYILTAIKTTLKILENKRRFIYEIITDKLTVFKRPENDIIKDLKDRGYSASTEDKDETYGYLLRLSIKNFTSEKLKELDTEISTTRSKLSSIEAITEKQMWLNDIDSFLSEYAKWELELENETHRINKLKVRK